MLKQQIQTATVEAMKGKDAFVVGVLRMLSAAILSKEIELRYKLTKDLPAQAGKPEITAEELAKEVELSDEKITEVISSEIKKRKDAIALYTQGNRPELAENEQKEIAVLMKYLPEQLGEEELRKLVEASIAKVQATEIKDTGKIMADLMPQVKGKADNSEISKIIKELLSK
jgi:uncharacterized protein